MDRERRLEQSVLVQIRRRPQRLGGLCPDHPGANMASEQLQGTMNWRVKDKMSMTASVGLEVTQLLGAESVDPIFSGTIAAGLGSRRRFHSPPAGR